MSWCSNNSHPFLLRQGPPWLSSLCQPCQLHQGTEPSSGHSFPSSRHTGNTHTLLVYSAGRTAQLSSCHPASHQPSQEICWLQHPPGIGHAGMHTAAMGLGKGRLPKTPAKGWGCAKPRSAAPKACRHPQVTSPRKAAQDACAAQGSRWIPWAGQASGDGHLQRAIREAHLSPDSQMGCYPSFPV